MYDREAAPWQRRRDEPAHRELVERTVDELAGVVAPPGPVADLGCGPGAHARALARRGYDVVGVDGSPRMVEAASARAAAEHLDIRFEHADVEAGLPFADGELGGVLAVLVLQHLVDPARFVGEIRRCLRPGGHAFITAPSRDAVPSTPQNLYWRLRARGFHLVPGVVRFYTAPELRSLVESCGLEPIDHDEDRGVSVLARAQAR